MNGSDAEPPSSIGCWNVGKCLGRGAFSGVYAATLKSNASKGDVRVPHDTNITWVLKLSQVPHIPANKRRKKTKSMKEAEAGAKLLFWEYQVYGNFLRDLVPIPRRPKGRCLYGETSILKENNGNGNEPSPIWRYLALERLGSTLRDQVKQCKDQKAPRLAVFNVAAQAIEALRQVHEKGIVFRDIKPENFMVGSIEENQQDRVYLVDFGASCKYILHDGKHMDVGAGPAGTPLYMSVYSHDNSPPSRRDDLISLGYMLLWMLNGMKIGLPWERETDEASVIKMKKNTSIGELCKHLDSEDRGLMEKYLDQVLNLSVHEDPDYEGLRAPFLKFLPKEQNGIPGPIQWSEAPLMKSAKAKGTAKDKPNRNKKRKTECVEISDDDAILLDDSPEKLKKESLAQTNSKLADNIAPSTANPSATGTKGNMKQKKRRISLDETEKVVSSAHSPSQDENLVCKKDSETPLRRSERLKKKYESSYLQAVSEALEKRSLIY